MVRLWGDLECAVMEHLWNATEERTVDQVRAGLSDRRLAYSTVMTVLRRLAGKGLVATNGRERAHRYARSKTRDEFVATSMTRALAHASDEADRQAALVFFVRLGGAQRVSELARALNEVDARHVMSRCR
ncbi:BlaI/MecI/CopY family transcriptional regulator [Mycolicibacterium nivoides]|jgi:predicted transcriptional regulator|uniref:BlaI/MecI/CopY family transcriptional regulator n=1 Tax=Mycolicibacterium nivoides TaxID=2487344 RepID=UPI003C2EEF68